jgi:hypothetical protein
MCWKSHQCSDFFAPNPFGSVTQILHAGAERMLGYAATDVAKSPIRWKR